jgi:hypothetical protein
MFDYGRRAAVWGRRQGSGTPLRTPLTRVVYLEKPGPEREVVRQSYPDGSRHDYPVLGLSLARLTPADLAERGLDLLLPFTLLPWRGPAKRGPAARVRLAPALERRQVAYGLPAAEVAAMFKLSRQEVDAIIAG